MHSIWKYRLPFPEDEITLQMPVGAEVLSCQMQHGHPYIWARVNVNKPLESRLFFIRGTGHPCPTHGRFVSTFQMQDGDYVFHLFDGLIIVP